MKKCILMMLLFSWMIVTAHNVNAEDGTVIIQPAGALSVDVYLNESSGIHGTFFAVNGTVNFLFLDPNGKVLFASNNACNGTINFEASEAGTYLFCLSNPSETQAVLIELNYSVKSWHVIDVLTFTLYMNPSWIQILPIILSIMLVVIKLLIDILGKLFDTKRVVMKELVNYKSPELPAKKIDSKVEKKEEVKALVG